ncbi:MAG TPA: hypothetical protein VI978_01740 [Candidatus Paceibacterota bacterium]
MLLRNKQSKITIGIGTVLTIFVIMILAGSKNGSKDLSLLARCLTEKGYIMYGADWCSYCQKEKEAFGKSFTSINYVDCPKDPQKCLIAGVQKYPTWITPDGKKLEGKQGIESLTKESGCLLQ